MLGVFLRPFVQEIVLADAGVGIEMEIRLVLARHAQHQLGEQGVLENIGEVAGMKLMAVGEHAESGLFDAVLGAVVLGENLARLPVDLRIARPARGRLPLRRRDRRRGF